MGKKKAKAILAKVIKKITTTISFLKSKKAITDINHMSYTITYALEYVLHTLEFSPDDLTVSVLEKELKDQPMADPNVRDIFAMIIQNDEKQSFDEVTQHLYDMVERLNKNATTIVDAIDEQGCEVVDICAYRSQVLDVAHE